ncbi:hypothetical protein MKW92_009227 [Papaver armeniacum]|nr:hypothetical protein MKW92_009227 [Papaver armeniacum]
MKYLQISFLMFFVLISFSFIHYVDGKKIISKAEEDDLEIERQLRVLNKKPVKTIINEAGDVIDCIDIYKQPAFDNSLLKDHKIRMNPSSIPGEKRSKNVSASSIFGGLQRARCPSGTVPIRRTTREDLVNAKYFAKKSKPMDANGYPNIGNNFVSVEEDIQWKKYFGAAAYMSIHNLTVRPDQYSTSQIWIVNSTRPDINSIQFGIMKCPSVFAAGDSRTRLFGYWGVKVGQQTTGCYNMLCDGFVQVSEDIHLEHPFTQSSIYGQRIYDVYLKVYQVQEVGDWWLSVGPNAGNTEDVGYWPAEIFTTLRSSASAVRFGGNAGSLSQASSPPMGNGYLPQLLDYKKTAFMRQMKYINEMGNPAHLDPRSVRTINGAVPQCYDIKFAGQLAGSGNTMAYGGPGGICN